MSFIKKILFRLLFTKNELAWIRILTEKAYFGEFWKLQKAWENEDIRIKDHAEIWDLSEKIPFYSLKDRI